MNRNPPVNVKRALREEVGFGCPVPGCGLPYLDWHHFDPPWHVKNHHDPQGMIALCREHHIQADNGAFKEEQLHSFKRAGKRNWMNRHLFARHLVAIDGMETDELVMRAINHPIGHITQALLDWWYRGSLEDDQGISDELRKIFIKLCDTRIEKYRHARVLLAAHVIAIFRVDPDWTRQNLLPLFDWQRSPIEARSAWEGFLWSPRLYRPLMEVIKPFFLETASHYDALGKHKGQYVALLTFASLDPGDTFTVNELCRATRELPSAGLPTAAQTLVRALEGAGDQNLDYWTNRIAPYLRKIWPKARAYNSPIISESLGRLCIAAKGEFPEALSMLRAWLQPIQNPNLLVRQLQKSNICIQFPNPSLDFLDLVISEQVQWLSADLNNCLEQIRNADSTLENDARYERLFAFLRCFRRD